MAYVELSANRPMGPRPATTSPRPPPEAIDWVIVGGESGPRARPMDAQESRRELNQVREAALALSARERAGLARDLLHSLEEAPSDQVDAAWLTEIEKRARELGEGTATPVDWEDARGRILERLRRPAS